MLTKEKTKNLTTPYKAKDYSHLLGMTGFSDKLLQIHFKLYQGYVSHTNTALEKLPSLVEGGKEKEFEASEVRRRLGWEFNGMRLHEYYFDNLGGKEPLDSQEELARLIKSGFGTFERWKKDFVTAGAMRGIGWVILYQDPTTDRLINFWIEEHNSNHPAGAKPLLVMDVFEHAYMADYGTDKSKYIESFFNNIDWSIVAERSA